MQVKDTENIFSKVIEEKGSRGIQNNRTRKETIQSHTKAKDTESNKRDQVRIKTGIPDQCPTSMEAFKARGLGSTSSKRPQMPAKTTIQENYQS